MKVTGGRQPDREMTNSVAMFMLPGTTMVLTVPHNACEAYGHDRGTWLVAKPLHVGTLVFIIGPTFRASGGTWCITALIDGGVYGVSVTHLSTVC